MGLKGIPNISEELNIRRDLAILEYTGGHLHIPTISTTGSVDLIRNAKNKKLNKFLNNWLNDFFTSNSNLSDFFGKNDWLKGINFKYNPGFNENIGLEQHIHNNFEKEFMINKPLVGLHKRNFDILLDQDIASSILSRGQQKVLSCILHLLSKEFIEKSLRKKLMVVEV